MTTPEPGRGSPARGRAGLLALRSYGGQLKRFWGFRVPAGLGATMPYVVAFAGVLLFAEFLWRIGIHCLNRLDGRGIENLYIIGMNELLAKDAAFFHDNFAGSLTKRVLSFASRFEDFADNLAFNIVGSLLPLPFASGVW